MTRFTLKKSKRIWLKIARKPFSVRKIFACNTQGCLWLRWHTCLVHQMHSSSLNSFFTTFLPTFFYHCQSRFHFFVLSILRVTFSRESVQNIISLSRGNWQSKAHFVIVPCYQGIIWFPENVMVT